MKTTFCLRDVKAKQETPIYCFLHFNRLQVKLATGCKVLPKLWSQTRGRVKTGATGEQIINATLTKIESDLADIFSRLTAHGIEPTPDLIRDQFAALRRQPSKKLIVRDLFTAYDEYIERSEYRLSTSKNHRKAKNHLKKFADTYKLRLTFDRLDSTFWERYTRYLLKTKQMTNDSAWNIIKSLRAFLADSVERGLNRTEDFRKVTRKSLPAGGTSEKPYLTLEELDRVESLDLADNPRLDRVRDLFVFLCYTGIRFGDSQQLRPENIDGDVLRLTLEKNRKNITTPLLGPSRGILDKYEGILPSISNQKGNVYLAEVLQQAGIDTPCQTITHSGTRRRETIAPKHELCGMHTAKRTYVSILRSRGVSIEALMKTTGNTRATLERYILRTEDEALAEIRGAWK